MTEFVVYTRTGKAPPLREQKATAQAFVHANRGRIAASFTEDGASGPTWPVLQKAIDAALSAGATLLIVYMDRLSRSAPFTNFLLKSGVSFVCCDMPDCNHRTIHIVAATAEQESMRIRTQTREGLAAARAAGVKLGSHREGHWDGKEHRRGWKKAYKASIEARKTRAALTYRAILPEIKAMRERGEPLPKIVEWLNSNNHLTTAGKPFTQTAVWRIIDRYLGKEYLGSVRRKKGDLAAGPKVGVATESAVACAGNNG